MNKLACLCWEKDWFCCTRNILRTISYSKKYSNYVLHIFLTAKLQNILLGLNILSPKLIKSISFYGSYVFAFKENLSQAASSTSCLILIYGLIKERSRPNRISCKSSLAYVFDFLHTSFGLTQTHEMSTL